MLQKEYTLDLIEFARWQDGVFHRRTLLGILQFYFGRVVALTFIVKLVMSTKRLIYPEYQTEMIGKTTEFVVHQIEDLLGIKQESAVIGPREGPLAVTIVIQYVILAFMALLIAANVQSFLKKLLVTLKNILRDNEIQLSYHTTILTFAFIMGTYYFSVLLQMSMQLP